MEEIGTSAKIAISMCMVVAIISVLLVVTYISKDYGNKYITQVNQTADPKYYATLKDLSQAKDTVPAVSIYASMCYCEGTIAEVEYDVDSAKAKYTIHDGSDVFDNAIKYMRRYFHRKLYVRVVQDSTDLLHVWIGDYPKTKEGWIIM